MIFIANLSEDDVYYINLNTFIEKIDPAIYKATHIGKL